MNVHAPLYDLLARVLSTEVDAALWAELRTPEVLAVLDRAAPGFAGQAWDGPALAEEFAALFLIPGGAAPFASAWLVAEAPEDTPERLAVFVHRALGALRVAQSGAAGNLSQDHAGLLFAIVAWGLRGSPEEQALAAHVHDQALAPWVGRFGEAVQARARSPLYRAIGVILVALHPLPGGARGISAG